jgi:hypothetical protein
MSFHGRFNAIPPCVIFNGFRFFGSGDSRENEPSGARSVPARLARGGGESNVREQVGEAHFGLDDVGVFVRAQSRDRDERDVDGLPDPEGPQPYNRFAESQSKTELALKR